MYTVQKEFKAPLAHPPFFSGWPGGGFRSPGLATCVLGGEGGERKREKERDGEGRKSSDTDVRAMGSGGRAEWPGVRATNTRRLGVLQEILYHIMSYHIIYYINSYYDIWVSVGAGVCKLLFVCCLSWLDARSCTPHGPARRS